MLGGEQVAHFRRVMDRFPLPDEHLGGAHVGPWLHRLSAEYRAGGITSDRFDLAQTAFREALLSNQLVENRALVRAWAGQGAMFEAQWNTAVREVKAFVSSHGRMPQRSAAADAHEFRLAGWVKERRHELAGNKLSDERCATAGALVQAGIRIGFQGSCQKVAMPGLLHHGHAEV